MVNGIYGMMMTSVNRYCLSRQCRIQLLVTDNTYRPFTVRKILQNVTLTHTTIQQNSLYSYI